VEGHVDEQTFFPDSRANATPNPRGEGANATSALVPRNTARRPAGFLTDARPKTLTEKRARASATSVAASAGRRIRGHRAHRPEPPASDRPCRIDHDGRRALAAQALHHVEGVFRVAVEVDEDDVVMLLEHLGQVVEVRRVGCELPNQHPRGIQTGLRLPLYGDIHSGPISAMDKMPAPVGARNLGRPDISALQTPVACHSPLVLT